MDYASIASKIIEQVGGKRVTISGLKEPAAVRQYIAQLLEENAGQGE